MADPQIEELLEVEESGPPRFMITRFVPGALRETACGHEDADVARTEHGHERAQIGHVRGAGEAVLYLNLDTRILDAERI